MHFKVMSSCMFMIIELSRHGWPKKCEKMCLLAFQMFCESTLFFHLGSAKNESLSVTLQASTQAFAPR
jgi:hypothetical protein